MAVGNKESLSDPLVDDNHRNEGLSLGGVVGLVDGLAELSDLLLEDLPSHGITDTISVDDEVLRVISVVVVETSESTFDAVLQLAVDDLSTLRLNDALRVVLTATLVDSGTETDNGVGACMTHVNANKHGP